MKSYLTKEKKVKRKWYVIDAKDKVFGRLVSEVASILKGRRKPVYVPNVDTGDYVIVINAGKIRLTGKKWGQRQHVYHTGYPGGRHEVSYKELLEKHPEHVMEYAVKGMIPKSSFDRRVLRRSRVYTGDEHLYEAQSPETYEF